MSEQDKGADATQAPVVRDAGPAVIEWPAAPTPGVLAALRAARDRLDEWQGVLPPAEFRFCNREHKVIRLEGEDSTLLARAPETWFFLGDLHGDFYALQTVIDRLRDACPEFGLVFLGDLVDRGPHPWECLVALVELASERPVIWIAGNHDIGLSFNGVTQRFASTVLPSESVDDLNARPVVPWLRFGLSFIDLAQSLPRAVLFPDGLLVTHGGFPLVDLQQEVGEDPTAWLNSDACLQDFTWTRITDYRRKIPNRSSTGCSFGFLDFKAFCECAAPFFPARRLLTGHDHPSGGVDFHAAWKEARALTLTGFAFTEEANDVDAYVRGYRDHVLVGRHRIDDVPEVIRIGLDTAALEEFARAALPPSIRSTTDDART